MNTPARRRRLEAGRPIAVFSPTLRAGGSEHVLGMLVRRLCERHCSVERVIAHRERASSSEEECTEDGAVIRGLGASRMLGAVVPLARYLRQQRPRCLLSSLTYANILVIASAMFSRAGIPVIVREATTVTSYARISRSARNRLLPALVRRFYRHADRIIAVSEGVRDDLVDNLGVPAEKVRVIYNPVEAARLRGLADREVGHAWFRDRDCPLIVSVARLDESKDFDGLIAAVRLVNQQRPVRFVVIGDGPERRRIESLAAAHGVTDVLWLAGHQENPYQFLARADVFLHPSKVEGLPNAVLEALALGRPIVSSDCRSGPAEILMGGRYGRLVPVGDAKAMARAILDSLAAGPNRSADASALARFDADRIVDAYLDVVSEVSPPVMARDEIAGVGR